MAVIHKPVRYEKIELTEDRMIRACESLFGGSNNYLFRNCFYRFDHEADLLILTKARYLYEIEVKLNIRDWNNDFKKSKHTTNKYIKNFYYAVPEELSKEVPSWVNSRYGVISVYQRDFRDRLSAEIIRPAQNLECEKFGKLKIANLFYKSYFYWRNSLSTFVAKPITESPTDQ